MADEKDEELEQLRARVAELEARPGPCPACDTATQGAAPKPMLSLVRKLHRWAAVVGCLFLLVMGVSGIVLGHADALGLQPLMVQLHAGLFLGPLAWLYCDVLGIVLLLLAATGIYMYVAPRGDRKRPSED